MTHPRCALTDAIGDNEVEYGDDVVLGLSNSAPESLHFRRKCIAMRLSHVVQALQQSLRPPSCKQITHGHCDVCAVHDFDISLEALRGRRDATSSFVPRKEGPTVDSGLCADAYHAAEASPSGLPQQGRPDLHNDDNALVACSMHSCPPVVDVKSIEKLRKSAESEVPDQ